MKAVPGLGLELALALPPWGLHASAASPAAVSHQGYVQSDAGVPVNRPVDLDVPIWWDPAAASPQDRLYREAHSEVMVKCGVFSISIGEGDALDGSLDAE